MPGSSLRSSGTPDRSEGRLGSIPISQRHRVCSSSGPFEHSSHGLLAFNQSTGLIDLPCGRPAAKMVGPGRLELPTSRLSGVRSNHLSYGPSGSRQKTCSTKPELSKPPARAGLLKRSRPKAGKRWDTRGPTLTRDCMSLVKKEKRRRRGSAKAT